MQHWRSFLADVLHWILIWNWAALVAQSVTCNLFFYPSIHVFKYDYSIPCIQIWSWCFFTPQNFSCLLIKRMPGLIWQTIVGRFRTWQSDNVMPSQQEPPQDFKLELNRCQGQSLSQKLSCQSRARAMPCATRMRACAFLFPLPFCLCHILIFSANLPHFSPEPQPPFFGALQWPTMREHDQSDSHDHVPAHMASQT